MHIDTSVICASRTVSVIGLPVLFPGDKLLVCFEKVSREQNTPNNSAMLKKYT